MKLSDPQYKVCKYIGKNNNLNYVLKKCKISDTEALQEVIDAEHIDFSDYKWDENTTLSISNELQAEFDENRHLRNRFLIPTVLSIIALILSILALLHSWLG